MHKHFVEANPVPKRDSCQVPAAHVSNTLHSVISTCWRGALGKFTHMTVSCVEIRGEDMLRLMLGAAPKRTVKFPQTQFK